MGQAVQGGAGFPATDAALLLRFFRDFVVAVHLQKEATWLWPSIVMRSEGITASAAGEVALLHEEATELIHCLVLFWEPGELSEVEREGFAATTRALHDRLVRMMRLEEQTLFPACKHSVPADDLLEWADEFARIESARGGAAVWLVALRDVLAQWTG